MGKYLAIQTERDGTVRIVEFSACSDAAARKQAKRLGRDVTVKKSKS
jgi:hypothetical protein